MDIPLEYARLMEASKAILHCKTTREGIQASKRIHSKLDSLDQVCVTQYGLHIDRLMRLYYRAMSTGITWTVYERQIKKDYK